MAMSDWKKQSTWRYVSKLSSAELWIQRTKYKTWLVSLRRVLSSGRTITNFIKEFKTKIEAVAYIKSYMRRYK